ncbi:protoporphyrinogen oxidase [Spirosoma sp. KUDC1026]|uniref:protoporphyrinogen oxidase n=1 Tax=Spirosoma sp. KUDC1026 TaxID=2745947 RepID=UPI00159BC24D|nr:protoporphyrinogen oxidase [Spirosoma sp. KUDC1026]QKZ15531.1 protoporphyrinogen oxidase [Spirosoma sp. KUDC1026]
MSIGIIGAGISGLTLAYELEKLGIDYHLWEASDQPGGYIRSSREKGQEAGRAYLRELGPNSLLGDDALLNWLDELGLTPELTFSKPVSKARYIFRSGQYRTLPSGPLSLLFGNFFSWKTKLAIWRERNNKTLSPPGETLGQFFRRRFSSELVEYALGPFVAGIYAGDPERLLVSETFPSLLAFEKEYGSVLRGFMKQQGGARKQSFSFREGMQALPLALANRLNKLSLNDPVRQIAHTPSGWQVDSKSGTVTVDRLVLAVGTDAAARLVAGYNDSFATALSQIAYPPMTAVHSVFKRADVTHPLNGFGGLNPKVEGRFAAGHIWSSSVFEGRCADDEVLITTFVGGQQNPANARLSDEQIEQGVQNELEEGFGVRTSTPVFRTITRWERAIPQYDAQIVAVKPWVKRAEEDDLFVCANWYGGISLSDCIGKAIKLAAELAGESVINNF